MPNDAQETRDAGLSNNHTDHIAAVLAGLAGMVPYAGGLIAELVKVRIPNQRIDRFQAFVQELARQLEIVSPERLKERLASQEFADIFEQAVGQAIRTRSDRRRRTLAHLLRVGVDEESTQIDKPQLALRLLEQLNDTELVILKDLSLLADVPRREAFRARFPAVFQERWIRPESSLQVREEAALYESFGDRLLQLHLIRGHFHAPRTVVFSDDGGPISYPGVPQIDPSTGRPKALGYECSTLGLMLLRYLNLSNDDV